MMGAQMMAGDGGMPRRRGGARNENDRVNNMSE